MKKLDKEFVDRMEGLSHIKRAVLDLLADGFSKADIVKYVWQVKI